MADSLYDYVGSSYLSAKVLGDRAVVGVVTDITKEEIRNPDGKTETKHVLYVEGVSKGLILNKTNVDALVEIAGTYKIPEIVAKGLKVELFVETVKFGSKDVLGIRLREALSRRGDVAALGDDNCPF